MNNDLVWPSDIVTERQYPFYRVVMILVNLWEKNHFYLDPIMQCNKIDLNIIFFRRPWIFSWVLITKGLEISIVWNKTRTLMYISSATMQV